MQALLSSDALSEILSQVGTDPKSAAPRVCSVVPWPPREDIYDQSCVRHLIEETQCVYGHESWWWLRRSHLSALDGAEADAVAGFAIALRLGATKDQGSFLHALSVLGLGFDDFARSIGNEVTQQITSELVELLAPADSDADGEVAEERESRLGEAGAGLRCGPRLEGRLIQAMGDLRDRAGDRIAAFELWRSALRQDPDPWCALKAAEHALKHDHFELSCELLEIAEQGGVWRLTRLIWAEMARRRGRRDEAFSLFEQALNTRPVPRYRARREEMREVTDRILALTGERAARWPELSDLVASSRAKGSLILQREPSLHRLRLLGAQLAREAGLHDVQARLLEPLIRQRNLPGHAAEALVESLIRSGCLSEAEEVLHSLEVSHGSRPRMRGLAQWLPIIQGRFSAVLDLVDEDPGDDPLARMLGALHWAYQGESAKCIEVLQKLPPEIAERPCALDLRASAAELEEDLPTAFAYRRAALDCEPTDQRRFALGRLATSLAFCSRPPAADLLLKGVEALSGCEDSESRALLCLGRLALGEEVDEAELPISISHGSRDTIELSSPFQVAGQALLRRRLRQGRFQDARDLAEILSGPWGQEARCRIRSVLLGQDLERSLLEKRSIEEVAEQLGELGDSSLVAGLRELCNALQPGSVGEDFVRGEPARWPTGLRLAVAHALVATGGETDRVKTVLLGLAEGRSRGSAEARLIMEFQEPDADAGELRDAFMACREGVFPEINRDLLAGIDVTRTLRSGHMPALRSIGPVNGDEELSQQVERIAQVREVQALVSTGASPEYLVDQAASLLKSLPEDLPSCEKLRDVIQQMKLPDPESGDATVRDDAAIPQTDVGRITEARRLVEEGFLDDAQFVLEAAYSSVVRLQDDQALQELLQLLEEIRDRHRRRRESILKRSCEAWLAANRSQKVLDATGGRAPAHSLALEFRLFRILAHLLKRGVREAQSEFFSFTQWSGLEGEVWARELTFPVVCLWVRGLAEHGQEWLDLLGNLRRGTHDLFQSQLRDMAEKNPHAPEPGLMQAYGAMVRGDCDEAEEALDSLRESVSETADELATEAANSLRASLTRSRGSNTEHPTPSGGRSHD